MILPDHQLKEILRTNIDPYNPAMVNPASLDLRLGNELRRPRWYWRNPVTRWLAWHFPAGWERNIKENPDHFWDEPLTFDRYTLHPGEFVLCHSLEFVQIPPDYAAVLFSKSSTGRMGLEHLHAGWFDPGFAGQATLEFVNMAPWPVELVAGMPIMQLVYIQMSTAPERPYGKGNGRYQGQLGPTAARDMDTIRFQNEMFLIED